MFGNFALLFTLTLLNIGDGFFIDSDVDTVSEKPMILYHLKLKRDPPCQPGCSDPNNEDLSSCPLRCRAFTNEHVFDPDNSDKQNYPINNNVKPETGISIKLPKLGDSIQLVPAKRITQQGLYSLLRPSPAKRYSGSHCEKLYHEALKYCQNEIFAD